MIFVTVGVQLPFDRLVRAVDEWAGRQGRADVVGQVGESRHAARHMSVHPRLAASAFRDHVERAELVVAPAGMGSILTARELGTPIIVMPRRAALGEHRNDHQLATSRRMAVHASIRVAEDEAALLRMLDAWDVPQAAARIENRADARLVAALRTAIQQPPRPWWSRLLPGQRGPSQAMG